MSGMSWKIATLDDVLSLIENRTLESNTLDYKDSVSKGEDILADIVAFANSNGGIIIAGVPEDEDGYPKSADGFVVGNVDKLKGNILNAIHDRVEPKLRGVDFDVIDRPGGKHILIVHVAKSHLFHVIRSSGTYYEGGIRVKSVVRNASNNNTLDFHQIKQRIIEGAEMTERIRSFIGNRMSLIASRNCPVSIVRKPRFVIHVVPFSAFSGASNEIVFTKETSNRIERCLSEQPKRRFNIDGVLVSDYDNSSLHEAYTQIYRSGIVESVDCGVSFTENNGTTSFAYNLDGYIINTLARILTLLKSFDIDPPFYVYVSLAGVSDCALMPKNRYNFVHERRFFDRDVIRVPELELEEYPETIDELTSLMHPSMNTLYQGAGWLESFNYDDEGNYKQALGDPGTIR